MKSKMTPGNAQRAGFALFLVLSCLAITTALFGVAFQSTVLRGNRVRSMERQLQAQWLAESGLEKAAQSLASNPDYKGEEWKIPAEAIGGRDAGVVSIQTSTVAARPMLRRIEVVARFPVGLPAEATATREVVWSLPEKKSNP
jgi:Tfp pilus assembly protein PilX